MAAGAGLGLTRDRLLLGPLALGSSNINRPETQEGIAPFSGGYAGSSGVSGGFDVPTPINDTLPWLQSIGVFGGTLGEAAIEESTLGIIKPSIVDEERKRIYPKAAAAGEFAGSILGVLTSLGIITGTISKASKTFRLLTASSVGRGLIGRVGSRGIHGSVTFGTRDFSKAIIENLDRDHPEMGLVDRAKEITERTMEGVLIGGVTGGVGGVAMFERRAARAFLSGTSMATATTGIKLLEGEEVRKEDVLKDFIIGAGFDFILGGTRKFKPRTQTEEAKEAAKVGRELMTLMEKESDLKGVTKRMTKIFGGEGKDKDFISKMSDLVLKYQKEVKVNLEGLGRKEKGKLKGSLIGQMMKGFKKVPELRDAFDKKNPSKQQVKLLEDVLEATTGRKFESLKKTKAGMNIQELKVMVSSIDEYNKLAEMDAIAFGGIKKTGLLKGVTPSWRYFYTLNANKLVEPGIKGKVFADKEQAILGKHLFFLNTEWQQLQGTTFREKAGHALRGKDIPALRKLIQYISFPEHQNPKFDPSNLKGREKEIVASYREFFDLSLARRNATEEYLGLPITQGILGYIRRVYKQPTEAALRSEGKGGRVSLFGPKKVTGRGGTSVEKKRKVELDLSKTKDIEKLVNDPRELAMDLLRNDLKLLYLEQPRRVLSRTLNAYKDQIPNDTKDYIATYFDRAIMGIPSTRDTSINNFLNSAADVTLLRPAMKKIGRELPRNLIGLTQRTGGQVLNYALIGWRPDMYIRNSMQRFLNLGIHSIQANAKAMLRSTPKWMDEIITELPFVERSKGSGLETAPRTAIGKSAGFFMTSSHGSNVRNSVKVALYDVERWVTEPKFYKHKWADKRRIAGELPEGGKKFFPSELKWAKVEAEYSAATTQYDYSGLGTSLLRSDNTGKMLFKYLSWPINYNFNFVREMISRSYYGRPGWATSGEVTLPLEARVGWVQHLVFTSGVIMAAKTAGIDMSSIGYGISPAGVSAIVNRDLGIRPNSILKGPLPDRGTHAMQLMYAAFLLVGGDEGDRKKGKFILDQNLNPKRLHPGASLLRKAKKSLEEESIKPLLFMEPFEPRGRSRGRISPTRSRF